MSDMDKQAVVDWFKSRAGKKIIIKMKGTTFRVEGVIDGVSLIDACSTEIEEAALDVAQPAVQVSLSFHDHTLSLHVLALSPDSKSSTVSIPTSIPYGLLHLSTTEEEMKKRKNPADESGEPEFSPYELLH